VVLARELTPSGYGVFAAALATTTVLGALAGFGVGGFWLKAFGAEGWGAVRWLTRSFRFVILSTTVTLLLLVAWAAFGPHDESFRWLLYWLLPVIVGYLFIELVSAKLQLEERYNALVRQDARADIFDYIERFYNPRKLRKVEHEKSAEAYSIKLSVKSG